MNSHFMPGFVYANIREAFGGPAQKLVLAREDRSELTYTEIKQYLLCEACEQNLSRSETWMSQQLLQANERFPLRDSVLSCPKESDYCYRTESHASIVGAHLMTFAAGMLWKGAHEWKNASALELGPYQERLRVFLLGGEPFPREVYLWVRVATHASLRDMIAIGPAEAKILPTSRMYILQILGVEFLFFIGQRVPELLRGGCFISAEGRPIHAIDHLPRDLAARRLKQTRFAPSLQRWAESNLPSQDQRLRREFPYAHRGHSLDAEDLSIESIASRDEALNCESKEGC